MKSATYSASDMFFKTRYLATPMNNGHTSGTQERLIGSFCQEKLSQKDLSLEKPCMKGIHYIVKMAKCRKTRGQVICNALGTQKIVKKCKSLLERLTSPKMVRKSALALLVLTKLTSETRTTQRLLFREVGFSLHPIIQPAKQHVLGSLKRCCHPPDLAQRNKNRKPNENQPPKNH